MKEVAEEFHGLRLTVRSHDSLMWRLNRHRQETRRVDEINYTRLRQFFAKPQYCPQKGCGKKLSDQQGLYNITVECDEDLESARGLYYAIVECRNHGCKGRVYAGASPDMMRERVRARLRPERGWAFNPDLPREEEEDAMDI